MLGKTFSYRLQLLYWWISKALPSELGGEISKYGAA